MGGVVQDVVDSIFMPGVNRGLLVFLHTACGALIITLIAIAVYTSGNFHVLALLGIALALWASITWFTIELQRNSPKEERGGRTPSRKPRSASQRRPKMTSGVSEADEEERSASLEKTLHTPKQLVPKQRDGTPVRRSVRSASQRRD